jgi:hypothetical protein
VPNAVLATIWVKLISDFLSIRASRSQPFFFYAWVEADLQKIFIQFFWSLPLVRDLPPKVRIYLNIYSYLLFRLVISQLAVSLGYLFMDELEKAVSQFYPSWGMYSSGGQAPGPSDHSWLGAYSSAHGLGRDQELGSDPDQVPPSFDHFSAHPEPSSEDIYYMDSINTMVDESIPPSPTFGGESVADIYI